MLLDSIEIFELFSSVEVTALTSAFISWGLMMALLYNLVAYSEPYRRPRSPLKLCFIINISYLATSFVEVNMQQYVIWAAADIVTVIILLVLQRKASGYPASDYCVVVLLCNAALHLTLFYDLSFVSNIEPWWFWNFYPIAINVNDIILIMALVLNKDFLGLSRLVRLIFNQTDVRRDCCVD